MKISRPEYWSGYPPNSGIKSRSPALEVDSLPAEPQGKPNKSITRVFDFKKKKMYPHSYLCIFGTKQKHHENRQLDQNVSFIISDLIDGLSFFPSDVRVNHP